MDTVFALKLVTAFAVLFLFIWNSIVLKMSNKQMNVIIFFEAFIIGFCVSMLYALILMYV